MKFITNKPSLPDFDNFIETAREIWGNSIVTNFGEFHERYLLDLKRLLNNQNVALACNATTALTATIKLVSHKKRQNVITTAFTFAATANSIIAAGKKPVFVDIKRNSFNLCPEAVRRAIDENTAAIMPVHCYGLPCDVAGFSEISRTTGIPIIYDAAHAFGVKKNGNSILNFGSASIASTHATKVFNSIEGGVAVFNRPEVCEDFINFTNFGIRSDGVINFSGFNGKMSELHAVVGWLNLANFSKVRELRQNIWQKYNEAFTWVKHFKTPITPKGVELNFGYYPLKIEAKTFNIKNFCKLLEQNDVFTRQYFSPILTTMPAFSEYQIFGELDNAMALNGKIICLPIHEDYEPHIDQIISIVHDSASSSSTWQPTS
jgi:dTDP-4-amino-4,6-dideoxygalactose transaminase